MESSKYHEDIYKDMNIYLFQIWGPYRTTEEVKSHMAGPWNDHAIVYARSKKQANEMVFAYSNGVCEERKQSGDVLWPNYQNIDVYLGNKTIVIESDKPPYIFTDDHLAEIQGITKGEIHHDVSDTNWKLFLVLLIGESKLTGNMEKLAYYIYADNDVSAIGYGLNMGDDHGHFDSSEQEINIEVSMIEQPMIFWNPTYCVAE